MKPKEPTPPWRLSLECNRTNPDGDPLVEAWNRPGPTDKPQTAYPVVAATVWAGKGFDAYTLAKLFTAAPALYLALDALVKSMLESVIMVEPEKEFPTIKTALEALNLANWPPTET